MSVVANTNSVIPPVPITRYAREKAAVASNARAAGPDLLRALAILLVMLVHLPAAATPAVLADIKLYGWIGVDLFFVLSGYLIGTQLLAPVARGNRPDLSAFYIRRSFRILPVYLFVVLVFAFVPIVRDSTAMQPLWRFLTFTMNFGLDARAKGGLTEVWSLCVEEHFYLALPVLIVLLRNRRSAAWTLTIAALIVIGGMALRFVIWRDSVGIYLGGKTSDLFVAYLRDIYYPSYLRLDGLLFGVLLAAVKVFKPDLWKRHARPGFTLPSGIAVLALGLWLLTDRGSLASLRLPLIVQPIPGAVGGFPLLALGFTLILAAMLKLEPILNRWRIPGAGTIATLSYSLYLTHKSVMHVDEMLLGKEVLQGLIGFGIYFASSIAIAVVIWWAIELPFLNLRNRISPSRSGNHSPGDTLPDQQDR